MILNILIGGKAGQHPNLLAHVLAESLAEISYYVFYSRDYQSLIRGGHNFNVLTFSDEPVYSNSSKIDVIFALDEKTEALHKKELTNDGLIIRVEKGIFYHLGQLAKIIGLDFPTLENNLKKIKDESKNALEEAKKGHEDAKIAYKPLQKLTNRNITLLNGSQGIAQGAINSKIDLYFAYPMTPATKLMDELSSKQAENKLIVVQPDSEITAVNAAIGASFAGAKAMVGTSGGGFDLMTEALSLQGQTEIPLIVYLASRAAPGTGLPTYTSQSDLNVALKSGHGEFPRIVVAPGDPLEAIEKTNECFYLSHKFNALSIILSDKHLAESRFSIAREPNNPLKINMNRRIPGKEIVKCSSYEHDEKGNTTENAHIAQENANKRLSKNNLIEKEAENFDTSRFVFAQSPYFSSRVSKSNLDGAQEPQPRPGIYSGVLDMIKIYGNSKSKNLIIGWGSTKGAILDAINGLDCKFLQILYLSPFSSKIKEELMKADKIILIENNSTAQLANLITEKTGFLIKDKILKYDGRPFLSDELKKEIEERLR